MEPLESCEVQIVERVIETFPDVPVVVVVSGGLHLSEFGETLRKAAYGYLVETIEGGQLLTIVRGAFAAHSRTARGLEVLPR